MIICDYCGREPSQYETRIPGGYTATKWISVGQQFMDGAATQGVLQAHRDFCSEECIAAYYHGRIQRQTQTGTPLVRPVGEWRRVAP